MNWLTIISAVVFVGLVVVGYRSVRDLIDELSKHD